MRLKSRLWTTIREKRMLEELFPEGRIPPSPPGETLREDVLIASGKSVEWLAEGLRLPVAEVQEILDGRRPITAETALRLSRFLGTSAELWLGLQCSYDLERARDRLAGELGQIEAHRWEHLVYDEHGQPIRTIWEEAPAPAG